MYHRSSFIVDEPLIEKVQYTCGIININPAAHLAHGAGILPRAVTKACCVSPEVRGIQSFAITCKPLTQPYVMPVIVAYMVAKPLVAQLVADKVGICYAYRG